MGPAARRLVAVDHRGFASRDRDSDHAKPSAWSAGRVNPCGASRSPKGAKGRRPAAGLRRPDRRAPTQVAAEASKGLTGAPAPRRTSRRRQRPWRRSWAAGVAVWRRPALLGIAKAAGLGMGPGGGLARRWVGVAQPTGNCAIVRNVGFRTRHPAAREEVQAAPGASVGWAQPDRPVYAPLSATWLGTPPGPPRTIGADRAARCRAEPDRRGRVGVAHATRKCALVRNFSQALGSNPAHLADLQGLGNTPRPGPDRGLSLGRAQWPSCLTTPATSLSCPQAVVSRRSHSRAST